MRVLAVYYTHKPGGFCKRLYRLLGALTEREQEVHYFSLDLPPAEIKKLVRFHRILFPLRRRNGILFWGLFSFWLPIYLLLASLCIRPKRLVAFGPYYAAAFVLTRLILRKPLTLFMRSALNTRISEALGIKGFERSFQNWVERVGILWATNIVCPTNVLKSEIVNTFHKAENSLYVLPNNIPTLSSPEKISPTPSPVTMRIAEIKTRGANFLVLAAGIINQGKNLELLITAFEDLARSHASPPLALLIAGDGPLRARYEASVAEKALTNVHFIGWVDDLQQLLRHVSLLIHPSLVEGMPNAVLEALGAGVPVLAADTPELRELFDFDVCLFDPHDPELLATRLFSLARNPVELEHLKRLCAARAEVYRFNWEDQACQQVIG